MAEPGPPEWMDLDEFVDGGFLQEVNRQFLHPLGLALAVVPDAGSGTEPGGSFHLVGVWDRRQDPEGIIHREVDAEKAAHVARLLEERRPAREAALGFMVQPVDWSPPVASSAL